VQHQVTVVEEHAAVQEAIAKSSPPSVSSPRWTADVDTAQPTSLATASGEEL